MRSILTPSQGYNNPGNALVYHSSPAPNGNVNSTRIEEPGFERPPPKGSVELFNPKVARRPTNSGKSSPYAQDSIETERVKSDPVLATPLVAQVASMSLEDGDGSHNMKEFSAVALST